MDIQEIAKEKYELEMEVQSMLTDFNDKLHAAGATIFEVEFDMICTASMDSDSKMQRINDVKIKIEIV